jgi:hypothetical protein
MMFDAERFSSTVAPASAAYDDGGIGVHRSSQISAWKAKSGWFSSWNTRREPNGTSFWPRSSIVARDATSPGVNCRSS